MLQVSKLYYRFREHRTTTQTVANNTMIIIF